MHSADAALARAADQLEVAAFASFGALAPAAVVEAHGLAHARIAGTLAFASRARVGRVFNHVFGAGLEQDLSPAGLRALVRFCDEAGAMACTISLPAGPRAEPIGRMLAADGFVIHEPVLRLVRDAAPAPAAPTNLRVRELTPPDGIDFGTVLGSVFPFPAGSIAWFARLAQAPQWRCFGAFDGNAMVGCGAMFTHGTHAWFGMGATLSSHRGRGAQSAILAARVTAARAAGATLMAAETSNDTPEKRNASTRNAERLGFRRLYLRATYGKALRDA
jgi:GNAT superfamily N-acetyltransferase